MKDLRLEATERDGLAVLAVFGEVDVATAPQLRQLLVETASSGHQRVVVDLAEVDFLDSTGLGILVSGLKRFRTLGGDLTVAAAQPRVRKVFDITGLTTVFGLHETVDDAVAALTAP
jgi:anti-sigma B factor antagonist